MSTTTNKTSIKVCDAIMGSGKSSAAINYINAHPERKFLYITPFLEEAHRIAEACPGHEFVEPEAGWCGSTSTKYTHALYLLEHGYNVTTTHELFKRFDFQVRNAIKQQHYTLIIDEVIDAYSSQKVMQDDIDILLKAGILEQREDGKGYKYEGGDYNGRLSYIRCYDDESETINLSDPSDEEDGSFYKWVLPIKLFMCFEEVILLTYMFDCQTARCYFESNHIPYKKIYTKKLEDGRYVFTDKFEYMPEYAANLSKLINIWEPEKYTYPFKDRCALSAGWFTRQKREKKTETIKLLKSALRAFFRYYRKEVPANQRLWTSFKAAQKPLSQNGYKKGFIPYNTRATNVYSNCTVLAYLVNVFMDPKERNYFVRNGISINDEDYSVSMMVQWIWRSAIRNGQPIDIYVPNKRMRNLLKGWIKSVEAQYESVNKGGDQVA